jgi:hypothetical protein
MSASLAAVKGSNGVDQFSVAVAINNKGDVVGWTSRPAGKGYYIGTAPTGAGIISLPTLVSYITFEDSPVIWSNSVPKVLPRSGTYNARGIGIADEGTVLASVSDTSGKEVEWPQNISPQNVRNKSHWTLLHAGQYTALSSNGKRFANSSVRQRLTANGRFGGQAPSNVPASWFNGKLQYYPNGSSLFSSLSPYEFRGVADDGSALVVKGNGQAVETCLQGKAGAMSVMRVPVNGFEVSQCDAMGHAGHVAGLMRSIDGNAPPRVFVFKDGTYTWASVSSGVGGHMRVNANGLLAFNSTKATLMQGGEIKALEELLDTPAPAGKNMIVLDLNDLGQVLVELSSPTGPNGSEELSYAVLSPSSP